MYLFKWLQHQSDNNAIFRMETQIGGAKWHQLYELASQMVILLFFMGPLLLYLFFQLPLPFDDPRTVVGMFFRPVMQHTWLMIITSLYAFFLLLLFPMVVAGNTLRLHHQGILRDLLCCPITPRYYLRGMVTSNFVFVIIFGVCFSGVFLNGLNDPGVKLALPRLEYLPEFQAVCFWSIYCISWLISTLLMTWAMGLLVMLAAAKWQLNRERIILFSCGSALTITTPLVIMLISETFRFQPSFQTALHAANIESANRTAFVLFVSINTIVAAIAFCFGLLVRGVMLDNLFDYYREWQERVG